MNAANEPLLKLHDVHKSFGDLKIIQGANLNVLAGERHALIGPNGAGKSTLFNLISGLYQLTNGNIYLKGEKISGLQPYQINRKKLARSFQITNIFNKLSVFENLRIGVMAQYGVRFNFLRRVKKLIRVNNETEEFLKLVRLRDRRDDLAGDLTYSEQRVLEIGMTLATGADVILLDEPTAGMSREETNYVVDLVREVTQDKTLLMVEHDMGVVFDLCDRISVLVYGEIIATGTPDKIRSNEKVQEAYLGEEISHAS
jgi:branched-chain amino acid transport system ATP-binding protein